MSRAYTIEDVTPVPQNKDQYVAEIVAYHYLHRQPYYSWDTDLARRRVTLPRIAILDLARVRTGQGQVWALADWRAALVSTSHETPSAPEIVDAELTEAADVHAARLVEFRARCHKQRIEALGERPHRSISYIAVGMGYKSEDYCSLLIEHQTALADRERVPLFALGEDSETTWLLAVFGFQAAGSPVPITDPRFGHSVLP